MSLFNLTRWPSILIFLLAGAATVIFAFVTVNLFSYAMANVGFLRKAGFDAIRHGALIQVVELMFWGGIALVCWVVFKICEHILVERYLSWAARPKSAQTPVGTPETASSVDKPGNRP
ncbi:MAG: hypothetical protein ACSHXD_11290 [Marinosulfonomonas sp.]